MNLEGKIDSEEGKGGFARWFWRNKWVRKAVLPSVAVASVFYESSRAEATLRSDFDNNGEVGLDDFFMFALHFGEKSGDRSWEYKYDLIKNGVIDFDDFFTFAEDFGKIESPSTPSPTPTPVAQIAFTSKRDGNYEVYVMNSDGSNQVRLTNNPSDDLYPSWSPDRSKIAFDSKRDGNEEIYSMNADGTLKRLTNNTYDDFSPSWSSK